MVNYRVSQEVIPPARGDVRFLGLGFLLFGCAEQVIVGEPQAVRSHDGHEHIAILVVDDVACCIFTEWVAELSIFDAPVFPGYESPGADERIGCHCPSLLALWAARALVRIMMPAAEAGRELRRTPFWRSSHSGDSQKFATPSNILATVKIRQMGDAPSTSGLLRWRCYVTRAEE